MRRPLDDIEKDWKAVASLSGPDSNVSIVLSGYGSSHAVQHVSRVYFDARWDVPALVARVRALEAQLASVMGKFDAQVQDVIELTRRETAEAAARLVEECERYGGSMTRLYVRIGELRGAK